VQDVWWAIGAEISFGRADAFESEAGQGRRVVLGSEYDLDCPGPADRVPVRLAFGHLKDLRATADGACDD